MKFTTLLSNLILESSRFQVLYDKLVKPTKQGEKEIPGTLSLDSLKNIIFADPTTKAPEGFDKETATPGGMENVKVGKYTQWLLKNFVSPKESDFSFEGERTEKNPEYKKARKRFEDLFMEDLFKQTERLQFYERVKQYLPQEQRDINKLGIKDLFNIFSNFQLPEKKRKEEEKKLARKTREGFNHAGGKIIFEGSNWVVIKIEDKGATGKDAAIYYGGYKDHRNGESDWCTSAPGLQWFDRYIKDGPLYVIFPQNDKGEVGSRTGLPKERYQFHFPSSQFMDRDDHQIRLVDTLNGPMSEIKEVFREEFAKDLPTQNGQKVQINVPNGNGSDYIRLYGFESLFEKLPENITTLNIVNDGRGQDEIKPFDVPETIARFKNLQQIMFNNIVKSIPDSISQCTKLSFISLPHNKELKSVPDSVADLKDLAFFNIKGCDPKLVSGETLPIRLKEKLGDAEEGSEEKGFYFIF